MSSVLITGFKNDECAKTFISWFEGQGEQIQDIWFDARNDDAPDAGIESQTTDCKKTFPLKQDENGNWKLILK